MSKKTFNEIKRILGVNKHYVKIDNNHYSKVKGEGYLIVSNNTLGCLLCNRDYGKVKHLLEEHEVTRSFFLPNSHFYASIDM